MNSHYHHQLCAEERACIMQMPHQGLSLRRIAAADRQAKQRRRQVALAFSFKRGFADAVR